MQKKWLTYGTHMYPSVMINNSTFRGQVTPDNVFEAICSGFSEIPKPCEDWFKKQGLVEVIADRERTRRGGTLNWWHALAVCWGLSCMLGCAFFFWRKRFIDGTEKEKHDEVNKKVQEFMNLQKFK